MTQTDLGVFFRKIVPFLVAVTQLSLVTISNIKIFTMVTFVGSQCVTAIVFQLLASLSVSQSLCMSSCWLAVHWIWNVLLFSMACLCLWQTCVKLLLSSSLAWFVFLHSQTSFTHIWPFTLHNLIFFFYFGSGSQFLSRHSWKLTRLDQWNIDCAVQILSTWTCSVILGMHQTLREKLIGKLSLI